MDWTIHFCTSLYTCSCWICRSNAYLKLKHSLLVFFSFQSEFNSRLCILVAGVTLVKFFTQFSTLGLLCSHCAITRFLCCLVGVKRLLNISKHVSLQSVVLEWPQQVSPIFWRSKQLKKAISSLFRQPCIRSFDEVAVIQALLQVSLCGKGQQILPDHDSPNSISKTKNVLAQLIYQKISSWYIIQRLKILPSKSIYSLSWSWKQRKNKIQVVAIIKQ